MASMSNLTPEKYNLINSIEDNITYSNDEFLKNKLIDRIIKFKEAGYDINDFIIDDDICKNDNMKEGWPPLGYWFIYILGYNKYNKLDILNILVEHGANINFVDENNNTMLHGCVISLNYKLLKDLLDTKIDINIKNKDGYDALELCKYIQNNYKTMTGNMDYQKNILDSGIMTEKELTDILENIESILKKNESE